MAHDQVRVSRALLSVSDKTGLVDFARALHARGIALVSTGGTHRALQEAGLPVTEVADLTGFPEMMDGRVKTLHPAVHGGLLAIRDNPEHQAALAAHGIGAIDLLVVNLYPFEATIAADRPDAECIENIDVGGPAMIRAAAKNHADVAVVTDVADYAAVLAALEADRTAPPGPTLRRRLAQKAFARTAAYDAAIANWMAGRFGADAPARFRAFGGTLAPGAALRREPAPGGRLLPGTRPGARRASRPRASFRARSCPTTTSTTRTPPTNASPNSTRRGRRRWRSSSTRTRAASPRARACWRPTSGRWLAIRPRPSAASWR